MGDEIARPRQRRISALRMTLASALTLSLLVGCAPEITNQPEDEFPPTSSELIAEALDAGDIDEPTSLLYRTWLYFGDPKFPEKFVGDDAPYEHGLLAEVRNKLDDLPASVRDQIEPYLLRPNDPASAFTSSQPSNASAPTTVLASSLHPVADPKESAQQCSTSWLTVAVVGLPFRVWACDDPAALAGLTPDEALDFVSNILIEYVPPMTSDLGNLIPDDPSTQPGAIADDLIDVYALPSGWLGPYRDRNQTNVPGYARTVQTSPRLGNTTSSYILVSLDHTEDQPLLERLVVHELFHAFHNTFHAKLDAPWWVEGSAEWAASYYVRKDSRRLHEARMKYVMDSVAPSILLDGVIPKYGAYIWPFFMEQQKGAGSIFDSLPVLATLPAGADTEDVIAVLDQKLDVSANYPELAVRLVNMKLAGNPIVPRFQDLDANFPDNRHPLMGAFTLGQEVLELNPSGILGLGYRDYRITVVPPPNHPPNTGVLVRVSGQMQTGDGKMPVLQALVRGADGEYSRERIAYSGEGDSVCVDEDMILVLANDSTVKLDVTKGTFALKRLDGEPCARIEVNDPNQFHALSDGDTVQVDGIEGDDEPDRTRLVVTVRGLEPSEAQKYEVKALVSGGTLRTPRAFTWPLSAFQILDLNAWRHDISLPLDIDLTDDNRPLSIEARLERAGTLIDASSPNVTLHGDQESQCFTDADIRGQVMHQIYERGGSWEYRPYAVDLSERFEYPRSISFVTFSDYANTVMQMTTLRPGDSDVYEKDSFHFWAGSFGLDVPSGATGTFVLESTLDYSDYTNIPWAKLPDHGVLPNGGNGQPLPSDANSSLRGTVTVTITRNLPSARIVEGTITGIFTDQHAYDRGTRLEVTLTFASAATC